ncbi:MAG: hypothetical protein KKE52_02510 [Alphaproteobacteria bacterium]|nr:hypothetical protein [Alphaproteobacteria bacterium]
MTTRRIRTERLIALLGGAVLILGVLLFWLVTRDGLGGGEPSAEERARDQLREHIGPGAVVRYTETGHRRAVCGYVSNGGDPVIFISRPNRILLETDPLKAEFDEMLRDVCPGFLTRPTGPRRGARP